MFATINSGFWGDFASLISPSKIDRCCLVTCLFPKSSTEKLKHVVKSGEKFRRSSAVSRLAGGCWQLTLQRLLKHQHSLAMRRHALSIPRPRRLPVFPRPYSTQPNEPIVSIYNAVFYRQHPTATAQDVPSNPAIFPNLTFEVPSSSPNPQHWAVIGPSSTGKTTFFEILRGQHLCFPPTARSFPYLSTPAIERKDHRLRVPSYAIQYVGFSGKYGGGLRSGSTTGAYLSARYESRREDTDFSVLDYLTGNVDLNPSTTEKETTRNSAVLQRVIADLKLEDLVELPVGNLSNGQTRRAKIAKALLEKPEVLLLDEPFSKSSWWSSITLSVLTGCASGPRSTNAEDAVTIAI